MGMTQYAMVNELASLVKDNLSCKHLVLSMEDAFVKFLQDDSRSNGVLELEPMNSYNRLLLHRLADIFGFSHESVGEGDERHLILERSPYTQIPFILVSDILCYYDDGQSPRRSNPPLKREEYPQDVTTKSPSVEYIIEERGTTDYPAGKQIFTVHVQDMQSVRQRPRHNPVVAQRMIAHALGKNISQHGQDSSLRDRKPHEAKSSDTDIQHGDGKGSESSSKSKPEAFSLDELSLNDYGKAKKGESKVCSPGAGISWDGKSRKLDNKGKLKNEHVGAAKRMFAHALGLQSRNL